jgi:hypothetical protein
VRHSGDFVRVGLAAVLVAGLAGCGGGDVGAQQARPAPSVSRSTEPPYIPSPIRTVTLDAGPTTAETTPMECRYATADEVEGVIDEPVTGTTVAVGGCWYRLTGIASLSQSVKVTLWENRTAVLDNGEVAESGFGGKAYWDDDLGNLEVQVGRNVLWVEVGSIQADDKLDRAKKLYTIVRKRI